jgi:hypothetical protein
VQSAEHAETPVADHGSAVCFACITGGSAASIGCRQLFTMYSSKISCSALHTTGEPIGSCWRYAVGAAHGGASPSPRSLSIDSTMVSKGIRIGYKERAAGKQTQGRAPAVRHRSVTTPFLRLPTYISRMRRSSFGAPFCSERIGSDRPQQSRAVPTWPSPDGSQRPLSTRRVAGPQRSSNRFYAQMIGE